MYLMCAGFNKTLLFVESVCLELPGLILLKVETIMQGIYITTKLREIISIWKY